MSLAVFGRSEPVGAEAGPSTGRLEGSAADSCRPSGVLIPGGSQGGATRRPSPRTGGPLQDVVVLVGLTDEELVARSVGGDTDSFNQLIKRWERPIYALAYRNLGREEDARDVCQETFLRAFRALNGFKGQAKFSSWLYRIALNLCRDWVRRERRAPVVAAPDGVDLVELAGEGDGVERLDETVARRDLSRAVARAMRALPDDQRTAIVLKEYHGLTFQEISELLGCPLSTVKTRLYQGLTVLRRELERGGIGSANGRSVEDGRRDRTARTI